MIVKAGAFLLGVCIREPIDVRCVSTLSEACQKYVYAYGISLRGGVYGTEYNAIDYQWLLITIDTTATQSWTLSSWWYVWWLWRRVGDAKSTAASAQKTSVRNSFILTLFIHSKKFQTRTLILLNKIRVCSMRVGIFIIWNITLPKTNYTHLGSACIRLISLPSLAALAVPVDAVFRRGLAFCSKRKIN